MTYQPVANPGDSPVLREALKRLGSDGYCLTRDLDPGRRQEVCYSVGMTGSGLPELISGMEDFADIPHGAPGLLDRLVGMMLEENRAFAEGDVVDVHGQWVRFIPQTLYKLLCDVLLGLYGSEFTLLQVVACEPNPPERSETRPICLN